MSECEPRQRRNYSITTPVVTDDVVRTKVEEAYRRKYPTLREARVTNVTRDFLPGIMAVVVCKTRGKEWDEVCYVRDDRVQIFDTTEELVRALVDESRSIESIEDLRTRRADLQTKRANVWQVMAGSFLIAIASLGVSAVVAIYLRPGFAILGSLYAAVFFVLAVLSRGHLRRVDAACEEIEYKIDLQRYGVPVTEARAEKILRLNDFQLRRYYESTLRQNVLVFWLGASCIVLGIGISVLALVLVYRLPVGVAGDTSDKLIIGILGAVTSLFTNYVAAIYLKMHAEAAKNLVTLHSRLVDTHRSLFGNLVASRITDEKLRWETLSKIALNVSQTLSGPAAPGGATS